MISQSGEPTVVIQDIDSDEERQETTTLLKVLALRRRDVESGKVRPASDVIAQFRDR